MRAAARSRPVGPEPPVATRAAKPPGVGATRPLSRRPTFPSAGRAGHTPSTSATTAAPGPSASSDATAAGSCAEPGQEGSARAATNPSPSTSYSSRERPSRTTLTSTPPPRERFAGTQPPSNPGRFIALPPPCHQADGQVQRQAALALTSPLAGPAGRGRGSRDRSSSTTRSSLASRDQGPASPRLAFPAALRTVQIAQPPAGPLRNSINQTVLWSGSSERCHTTVART